MTRIASIDGQITTPDQARVSIYDRGFLYGDSVFETIRTYRGEPFSLSEHVERLERSAERVLIPMPVGKDVFAGEIRAAVAAADNPESYIRAMLTRGSGPLGLDPAHAEHPLRVIIVEPLTPLPAAMYREGVSVVCVQTKRTADAAQGAKVGNYLESLLALSTAKKCGAHEALIVSASGHVVEGTTSNVFAFKDGTLITPGEEAGILAGITRAHILKAAEHLRLPIRFETLLANELISADEVFLSSSIREILPIVRIGESVIAHGQPGPLTRRLHTEFRRLAGLADLPMPWENAV